MSTVADYVGRTVDVLAFLGADYDGLGSAKLIQELVTPEHGGLVTTGIQKLAQRYLLELLTSEGSMPFLPNRGSSFMIEGRQGFWKTAADVKQSFNVAEATIKSHLVDEESDTDPLDEKYHSSELLTVIVSPDSVVARISLTSKAGTSRELITPINVSPERTV